MEWTGDRGLLAFVCNIVASGLGERNHPNSDDLDDYCPPSERGR